jgi:hypothetical protein
VGVFRLTIQVIIIEVMQDAFLLSTVYRELSFQEWFIQNKKYGSYFRSKCSQFVT